MGEREGGRPSDPWVVLLVDRRDLGAAIGLLNRKGSRRTFRPADARRFHDGGHNGPQSPDRGALPSQGRAPSLPEFRD